MEGGANFVFGEEHRVINVVIDTIRKEVYGPPYKNLTYIRTKLIIVKTTSKMK